MLHTRSEHHSTDAQSLFIALLQVEWWGWGWGDAVGFLRHCVTVISGGTGAASRSRPWILVTGCWWSLPTFLGTLHSGTYSQRCRSRSWEAHQPSADTQRGKKGGDSVPNVVNTPGTFWRINNHPLPIRLIMKEEFCQHEVLSLRTSCMESSSLVSW